MLENHRMENTLPPNNQNGILGNRGEEMSWEILYLVTLPEFS